MVAELQEAPPLFVRRAVSAPTATPFSGLENDTSLMEAVAGRGSGWSAQVEPPSVVAMMVEPNAQQTELLTHLTPPRKPLAASAGRGCLRAVPMLGSSKKTLEVWLAGLNVKATEVIQQWLVSVHDSPL